MPALRKAAVTAGWTILLGLLLFVAVWDVWAWPWVSLVALGAFVVALAAYGAWARLVR